jgi:hypothetical protein
MGSHDGLHLRRHDKFTSYPVSTDDDKTNL